MKVVLDTNVLIAAFVAHGVCHELFEHVCREHELVLSRYILNELDDKLTKKLGFTRKESREVRTLILEKAKLVEPSELGALKGVDADDVPVLGTAKAAECACLVTGDKGLRELESFESVPIVAPADFWRFEDDRK